MNAPTRQRPIVAALALLLLAAPGCDRDEVVGPPEVYFGQDVCDVCHMIISDERFAAGLVLASDGGRHERLAFDDIGCIFEYESAHPDAVIVARYVRDYETQQWIDMDDAEFIHSDALQTPMGFGLAAVADLDRARQMQAAHGGEFLTFNQTRQRFDAGTLSVQSADHAHASPVLLVNVRTIRLSDDRTLELSLHTPQQLVPGRHPFELQLSLRPSASSNAGAPDDFEAFALSIEPAMPAMGHGSPGNEDPAYIGDGRYRGLVNFTMSGHWTVRVTVSRDGRPVGEASFDFEVQS